MNYGPDYSDSEDSLLADDGDYYAYKDKLKAARFVEPPAELSEEEQRERDLSIILNAATSGSINTIQDFISKGFPVDSPLKDEWTVLMLAINYGHLDLCKLLIDSGANVNLCRNEVTPLMMACETSNSTESFDIIKLLVENGANVQAINRKRMNAVMYAASAGNLPAVEYLLPLLNKDATDNQNWTALTWAVNNNQPEVVEFLLRQGFSIDMKDVRGETPVDIAVKYDLQAILDLFPKQDQTDMISEIIINTSVSYKEQFGQLKKHEMPLFFEDVCGFLLGVKCYALIPLFHDRKVALSNFLTMDDDDLKRLGVRLPYQRNRILTGLHRFHKYPYHPNSMHVCVNSHVFSNIDVAIQLVSAVKQLICMESSLKYISKRLVKEEVPTKEKALMVCNVKNIKKKIEGLKAAIRRLKDRVEKWDAITAPPDLITKSSIRSHFPWKKLTFCLSLFSIAVLFKLKHFITK